MYQVSRSNSNEKFTFKNSSFCRYEGNFDGVTSLWRHDVILTSRDHVHSISREVFIKCTKFQDRTLMGSLLLKIARFVVMKVILTAWRHYDVILTSRDHVHSISREVFIKCTKFQDRTLMGSLLLKIARFVVMKVILTAWRHDVILTSRDHVHSISCAVFIKCTKF